MKERCKQLLKEYWGYSDFRPSQWEVIESVLKGKDSLALFPTGGGKSLCYQIPGLFLDGLAIIISPLIALMEDQIEELQSRGITAKAYNSNLDTNQKIRLLDDCESGSINFLFIAPESLKNELFIQRLQRLHISFVTIDEAHCIAQWGHDFRPSYFEIALFRSKVKNVPFLALTATATEKVITEIIENLGLIDVNIFKRPFFRENLSYFVLNEQNTFQQLINIIKKNPQTGIVYANSRKKTVEVANWLSNHGANVAAYHAGLAKEKRSKIQEQWKKGHIKIVVATNAFGMGINKENVRWVCHLEIPESCEAYFQEAGRAGRDGKPAFSVILYQDNGKKWLAEKEESLLLKGELVEIYQKICNYFHIAIGDGLGNVYSFSLEDFLSKTGLTKNVSLKAFQYFQAIDLLKLNQGGNRDVKIKIFNKQFNIQNFNPNQTKIILLWENLLRNYPLDGNQWFSLNLEYYTRILSVNQDRIKSYLRLMENMRLIKFQDNNLTKMTFLHSREESKFLRINESKLNYINKQALHKAQQMYLYVENKDICRANWILDYFGDSNTGISCGTCDICIRNNRSKNNRDKIQKKIHNILQNGAINLKDLVGQFNYFDKQDILDILNEWKSEEKITLFRDIIRLK